MKTKIPPREEIIRRNPKVDWELVAAHEKLEKELKRLGVDTKVRYTLGIPLTEEHRNAVLPITRSKPSAKRNARTGDS